MLSLFKPRASSREALDGAPARERRDSGIPEPSELLRLGLERAATIARRRACNRSDLEDLAQVGRLAVLSALRTFDPGAGFPFEHYVSRAIRNEVCRELRRLGRQRSREDRTQDVYGQSDTRTSLEHVAEVRQWVARLPEALKGVYLALYVDGLTQRQAASRLGLSQPRVSQLHRELLRRGYCEFGPDQEPKLN